MIPRVPLSEEIIATSETKAHKPTPAPKTVQPPEDKPISVLPSQTP